MDSLHSHNAKKYKYTYSVFSSTELTETHLSQCLNLLMKVPCIGVRISVGERGATLCTWCADFLHPATGADA